MAEVPWDINGAPSSRPSPEAVSKALNRINHEHKLLGPEGGFILGIELSNDWRVYMEDAVSKWMHPGGPMVNYPVLSSGFTMY